MNRTAAWDDPARDIGADMIALSDQRAAAGDAFFTAAAQQMRRMFRRSEQQIAAAAARLRTEAQERLDQLDPPAAPGTPAWKRVPKHTWHGGTITEADLNLDYDRIAQVVKDRLDYTGRQRLRIVHLTTGLDITGHITRARQNGKLRELEAWADVYESTTGEAVTHVRMPGDKHLTRWARHSGYDPFDDPVTEAQRRFDRGELDQLRKRLAEQLRPAIQLPMRRYHSEDPTEPYLQTMRSWAADVSDFAQVPWHLLDPGDKYLGRRA